MFCNKTSSMALTAHRHNCIVTARKRSLRRLCFYRCLSVHTGGGMCGFIWGACVVLFGGHAWFYLGGVHGFIRRGACVVLFGGCVVLFGGHVWFYWGGECMVLFGGCAWLYLGGIRGFIWGHAWFYSGGIHGFLGGHAWFFGGGMHGVFSFFGYNEIRSMSGPYASYWNAFLFERVVRYSFHDLPVLSHGFYLISF